MELEPKEIADWLKLLLLIPFAFFFRWLKMRISKAISNMVAEVVLAQVMPTINDIQGKIGEVRNQVLPNGGKSLNDRVMETLRSSQRR